MKKVLLSLTVLLLTVSTTIAQERNISGRVTSPEDDLGMPGVTVVIKGSLKGVITDMNGNFLLSGITNADTLVFSYVGFETQEIVIGAQKQINILLQVSAAELDEFVVTALGVKRQKREIGYSTEKIDKDIIVRSNAPNVLNAITGRAAGVQVTQGDGMEGGTTRIIIRGNNNLFGNNQPLIVVDNVPLDNPSGLESIGRGIDWGNGISDINPLDIETYNVLKGGAASALYGARGANGVILITTKRGKKKKGIGVSYSFTYRIIQPYRYRDAQDKYGAGGPISFSPPSFPVENDTLLYPGIYGTDNLVLNQDGEISDSQTEFGYYGSSVSWGPEMKGQMVKWWDGEMRPYSAQPDNYSSVFQNGYTQTHNIAASGGGKMGSLRVSITRQDHKAIIENSDFDRTTINLGANMKVSKKVSADVSLSYIKFNRLNSPMIGDHGDSFSKGFLYSWPRSYKLLDRENYMNPDGTRNEQEGFPFYYISPYLWWKFYENNTQLARDKYFGALTLTYNITSWLNVMGRVGRDFSLDQYTAKNTPIDFIGLQGGYYSSSLNRTYSNNYEFILSAEKKVS
ncbi:MAG: TonB-dependent receptor plug domain-containing protein, partial [Bacteroidales bacterium]|nr:TonB-dependent receptor plug domain-containing protein [Bacteroidales bacterium]